MRYLMMLTLVSVCCPGLNAADEAAPALEFKTTKDKVSYGIGMNIGMQFKRQGVDIDPKMIAAGIASVLDGTDPALSQAEIQAAFKELQTAADKKKAAAAGDNTAAAQKFLAENAKKKGVKTTKSGLQYMVIKEGSGATPTTKDTVEAHYRGKLLSGKVFDESYKGKNPTDSDKPVAFGVTRVIKGWTEALQLMKVGATYRLFIPPALAYGENGPPSIGPNSLLIFDITLAGLK